MIHNILASRNLALFKTLLSKASQFCSEQIIEEVCIVVWGMSMYGDVGEFGE